MSTEAVHIVGGGMAGCEAAWQLASAGVNVVLYEMRPKTKTFAHKTSGLAELVCSNSFRSNDHENNAVGLLQWEMNEANSLIIRSAYQNAVPAGGALAVDREKFSTDVTDKIKKHPLIKFSQKEIKNLNSFKSETVIIASGPLSSASLIESIIKTTNHENLAFFDAIAPIIYGDSIDMSKAWFQSRYDKGHNSSEKKAYLNCALNRDQYYSFIKDLISAEQTDFHQWEKNTPYFNGCLPIEIMAERGVETLRFGPMKPVGLTNPNDPKNKPYAIVQLRRENKLGTMFNMVGFQTKMKYAHQTNVFRKIPGLENARFARLGGIHRNTFIKSPKTLNKFLTFKTAPNIYVAGQITGVEGYLESAAIGLLVAKFVVQKFSGKKEILPPPTTAIGALYNHLMDDTETRDFQPMNINFGLFPKLIDVKNGRKGRKERYKAYTRRAKSDLLFWLSKQK